MLQTVPAEQSSGSGKVPSHHILKATQGKAAFLAPAGNKGASWHSQTAVKLWRSSSGLWLPSKQSPCPPLPPTVLRFLDQSVCVRARARVHLFVSVCIHISFWTTYIKYCVSIIPLTPFNSFCVPPTLSQILGLAFCVVIMLAENYKPLPHTQSKYSKTKSILENCWISM